MTGLLQADAVALPLADDSVDLVVTSPPYFALRSYRDAGGHYAGQIGSEAAAADDDLIGTGYDSDDLDDLLAPGPSEF